ncbi:MAG: hypothetical protein IJY39_11495, partial [Clostridia bacterium]|nr:hypothetical protein [Clostridia bacterium]
MTFILNKNIALRSWWRVPYAYYVKGRRDAQRLTKEEFELLSLCDGQTEIADSSLVERLVQRRMISACEVGAACLD